MTLRGIGIVAVCIALVACDSSTPEVPLTPPRPVSTPTGENSRVIGLVGTMSGRDMWRGEDAWEGAQLGVHRLNRRVDEGRRPFELVTMDDRGDAERATELVTQLAQDERTVGIIYAGPPEGLPPAERALTEAGIPALICHGDLYAARLLRPHVFQMSPSFLWQARAVSRYVLNDRRYRTVGVLTSRSLDGDTALASMRAALSATGPHRLVVARYGGARGVRAGLDRMAARSVEALVVEGSPTVFVEVVDEMRRRSALYRSTAGARVASARGPVTRRRRAREWFRPQLVGFDAAISPDASLPTGTVASDSYARGVHHLPIRSFERFRDAFVDWWGDEPLGWEVRAFDAVSMIGWAVQHSSPGSDTAGALERLDRARFGGLDVTFGPDDHTAVDQTSVGLWVRPRAPLAAAVPTDALPWLPLARGFSIDGTRTSVLPRDWRHLFRNPPPPDGPAPRVTRMRFAVNTPRSDPVH